MRAISRGILSGGNYLWDNCPEAIILGQLSNGQLSGGQLSERAVVGGGETLIQGTIFLGGSCPRDNQPGGNFPEGNFPRRQFSGHPLKVLAIR